MLCLVVIQHDFHGKYPPQVKEKLFVNNILCLKGRSYLRAKLQNTPQLTPSLNLLLPQSRSRHNLHNKLYIKTTNIPRSFIHCGTADRGSTTV